MATYTSNYAWAKPSGSDPVDISVLNGNLDSQDGIIHDAFLNMAVPFSELSTYTVGNIVLYGTKTYKCRVPVTTPGSWTGATNWDEYKLAELTLDNTPTDGSNNPVKSDGIYDSEKDIYAVMGQMGAKNLLIYPYYEEDTKTYRGVTYTVNADNTISLSGTADGGTSSYVLHPSSQNIKYPAGTYLLSGCPTGGARNSYWMQLAHGGTVDTFDLGEGASVTLESEQVVGIGFYVAAGVDVTGKIIKPMLRLASDTDDTYQPYAKTNKQLTDEIANKVDKVTGKGLSTNDYDNTAKGIVDGVTANLALKADKTATASGETLALVPTSEGRALLHTAYGMSTQSGTPTPSSPVDIVSANADFRSVGKNILPYPYPGNPVGNLTIIDNGDGSITLNGTASEYGGYVFLESRRTLIPLIDVIALKEGSRYNINFDIVSGSIDRHNNRCTVAFRQYIQNATNPNRLTYENDVFDADASGSFTFSTADGYIYGIIYLEYVAGVEFKNCRIRPMITLADVTDETYEPYTKHDTTTDITLRAIEVSSSDAYNLVRDGKYYIADTLDYSEDNGWTVTRRIGHIASYDSETLTTKWMSSKDVYASGTYPSAGAVVDYILTTETTETITTAQALALLGLKTYDESTTISSQAEPACTVAVEYAKERLGALALTAYNTAKGNDLRITALEG